MEPRKRIPEGRPEQSGFGHPELKPEKTVETPENRGMRTRSKYVRDPEGIRSPPPEQEWRSS